MGYNMRAKLEGLFGVKKKNKTWNEERYAESLFKIWIST